MTAIEGTKTIFVVFRGKGKGNYYEKAQEGFFVIAALIRSSLMITKNNQKQL